MVAIPADTVAIDMHIHLSDELVWANRSQRVGNMAKYFGRESRAVAARDMAEMYRSRSMVAVVMNSTDVVATGSPPVPNDHVAQTVSEFPDALLGFGIVDPHMGAAAVQEARRCKEIGLIGLGEFNPARQHFYPNDPEIYRLWAAAEEMGMPVLFHGGYAAAGSGTRGGSGVKLKYANPMALDDVAADFPDLKIICAHPSWPWESEALAVVMHKPNVYMDLSGWAPRYMSHEVRSFVNSRVPDKIFFGSDWPVLDVDRWLGEFNELDLKPEVKRKVLLENATRFLAEL